MTRIFARWLAGVPLIWCLGLLRDVSGCSAFVAVSLTALANQKQTIQSENYPGYYPDNDDRCWKIKTELPGYVINLETENFHVEIMLDIPCGNADYLEIRDGYFETAPLLKKMCGTEHANVTSSGQFMYLRFKSDESVGQRGFVLTYQAIPSSGSKPPPEYTPKDECRETTKLTAFATITSDLESPNFPHGYPPSVDRCWLIQALDEDHVVLMKVVDALLEESYSCESGDFVEARDGKDLSDKRLTIFCGDTFPDGFKSTGRHLLLRFHTDQTENDFPGFHIQYSMVEPNNGNGGSSLSLDQSMQVLIGVGVVVIALAVIFAVIGFYKKNNDAQVHSISQSRRVSRQSQPTGDATIRLAVESILNQPMSHMTITQANLRAPPPYEGPPRPPSHVGFVAPTQPGYSPWMVPNAQKHSKSKHRHHRHRRRSLNVPATIQQYHDTMFPPGTPVPPETPRYEEILKALDESDWGLPVTSGNGDVPTIVVDDIDTEPPPQNKEKKNEPNNDSKPGDPPPPADPSTNSEPGNNTSEEIKSAASPAIPGFVDD